MAKTEEEVLKEFMDLPGVGMSKAKALYEAGYDSLETLAEATVDELKAVKSITKKLATDIVEHFGSSPKKAKEPEKSASDDDIMLEKGMALFSNGKWGQALQIVNVLIDANPQNVKALQAKGSRMSYN